MSGGCVGDRRKCIPGSRHVRLVSLLIFPYLVTLSLSLVVSLLSSFSNVDKDGDPYMPTALDKCREEDQCQGLGSTRVLVSGGVLEGWTRVDGELGTLANSFILLSTGRGFYGIFSYSY